MTSLASHEASFSTPTSNTARPNYFVIVLCWVALINVLTFIHHVSHSSTFNALSNAGCVLLIAYGGYVVFRSPTKTNKRNVRYIAAAIFFTVLSVSYNGVTTSIADGVKYLSIFILYAAGHASASRVRPVETWLVCFLAALPILFLLVVGTTTLPEFVQANPGSTFSYFANTGVATLYFAALVFIVADRIGWRAILLQIAVAVVMNKIGAIVATVAAVCLWIGFPLRKESLVAFAFFAVVALICLWSGALDRILLVLESMKVLAELGPDYVSRMSFGRLVELTGTTDLSGFFRVIHWRNIWDIYSSGGPGVLLFGYGIGQTPILMMLPFVPHNDYLRVLAEYGPANLAVFVLFLLHVLRHLRTGVTKVLFIVLMIYFFSENLIDHFPSMALYFTYAGRFSVARRKQLRHTP